MGEEKRMKTYSIAGNFAATTGFDYIFNLDFKVKRIEVKTYYTATDAEIAAQSTVLIKASRLSTDLDQVLSAVSFYPSQSSVKSIFIFDSPIDVRGEYAFNFTDTSLPSASATLSGQMIMFMYFYSYL